MEHEKRNHFSARLEFYAGNNFKGRPNKCWLKELPDLVKPVSESVSSATAQVPPKRAPRRVQVLAAGDGYDVDLLWDVSEFPDDKQLVLVHTKLQELEIESPLETSKLP